jgi:hypothetical protein
MQKVGPVQETASRGPLLRTDARGERAETPAAAAFDIAGAVATGCGALGPYGTRLGLGTIDQVAPFHSSVRA